MKLLIIGCGPIGRRHAQNAKDLGTHLVLCDNNKDLIRNLSAELGGGIPCYEDYLNTSKESGSTAAVIASPSYPHVEMTTNLANRGLHLFVENLLSNTLEETQPVDSYCP